MNCFFHPNEAATASCVDCGKGLCQSCTAKYQIAICDDCNQRRNAADKNAAIKKVIPSAILFIVFFILGFMLGESNIAMGIALGWLGGGTVWGWFITGKWFRPKAYINTGMDYNAFMRAARMTARIVLSEFVGIVAMPIEVIKLIIALVKVRKVSKTIDASKE